MEKKIILDFLKNKYSTLEEEYIECVVDKFFQTIAQKLKNSDRIEIRNFGVFKLKELEERTIYNPHTEELVKASKKRIPIFKCSKRLHKLSA